MPRSGDLQRVAASLAYHPTYFVLLTSLCRRSKYGTEEDDSVDEELHQSLHQHQQLESNGTRQSPSEPPPTTDQISSKRPCKGAKLSPPSATPPPPAPKYRPLIPPGFAPLSHPTLLPLTYTVPPSSPPSSPSSPPTKPCTTPSKGDLIKCCICLKPLRSQATAMTGCGHTFHKSCVLKWFAFRSERLCPVCKVVVESVEVTGVSRPFG